MEKPYGKVEIKGTLTLPKEEAEVIRERVTAEVIKEVISWKWIFMAGGLCSLIISLVVKK